MDYKRTGQHHVSHESSFRGGPPSYPKARTAEGVHIYAIGDMHGMVELAAGMFDKIDADIADWSGKVIIIGLGDYIDRGPRSN